MAPSCLIGALDPLHELPVLERVADHDPALPQVLYRPQPLRLEVGLGRQGLAVAADHARRLDDLAHLPAVEQLEEVLAGVALGLLEAHPLAPLGAPGGLAA